MVRVCLIIVAELVFMGKEDRNCIPKHIVSLVKDFDSWNDYPWGEYMWEISYKRTVNVVAIHRADHLKKKKQNSDYYPTHNLYGFAWAFKDSNPNLELYATLVEKQTGWFIASIQFIKGLVDEDLNVTQDDGVGVVSGNCGETVFFNSEGGATNPESNKDKQPTLANVLDEVRALRKEVALVKFEDARISKLEGLLHDISRNGNHNAVNQGLSGLANHPMSTCSRPDIDNAEVVGHVNGIHKADGKNDSPNSNQNGVNKGLSCSANDPLADGNNDSPNVNHNAVNKGLSCSANDLMSTCSSLDMDNGEVAVAGMGIHMADGQNDIPNANDNVVNQGIIGSANDPMLDVLIQVACDGMGIDKADGNNDYTYSQREPSTLDVLVQGFDSQKNHPGIDVIQHDTHVDCSVAKLNDHPTADIGVTAVDEFADDFMDVLNDEEIILNYSLDDMKLQNEEVKLISTPAPVNHQQVDEFIDMHEDKTIVLQENVKTFEYQDLSNKSQYVNVVKEDYKPCLGMVFANVKAKRNKCGIEKNYVLRSVKERKKRLSMSLDSLFGQQETTTLASPKTISKSDGFGEPKMRSSSCAGNGVHRWRYDEENIATQLTLYLIEHGLYRARNSMVETYEISNTCFQALAYREPDSLRLLAWHKTSSSLTSWFSKKQTALAISTTEAEYVSTGKACQQALWMKQALIDYDVLTCQDMCDEFAKIMHDEFEMSMMGELNFFLGLQIKQMEDGIFFNQSKYIKEMLKKFGLEDSKPMKTPMSSDTKLTKDEECESVDSTRKSNRCMIVSPIIPNAIGPIS
ncbi:phospholipase-like protein [Tanacetum coccineum]|uniref:Phospholipase-like protein n=1 Tax=Tanacetum coccineum TaxID=301880 RepID=A0ABQ4XQJ5_9ASTR